MTQAMKTCLLLSALIFSLCLLAPARADAASEARQALENTVNQVLAELQKPGLHDPDQRKKIEANLERIVLTLFNFEELSMRTVGPNWRNFTPDQQKRFMDAFENLLRERYTDALDDYSGETVTYLGETPIGTSGNRVQIDTTVTINNRAVSVNYRMQREQDSRWMVYDIIIEGVGMVQNYRSQFQSVLQRGNAEELITLVRARADEMREASAKRRQSRP
jgi:phospholipid transport system substrate-binding protein